MIKKLLAASIIAVLATTMAGSAETMYIKAGVGVNKMDKIRWMVFIL